MKLHKGASKNLLFEDAYRFLRRDGGKKRTIYSAISSRRICTGYARFEAESHLDRHTT